MKKLLIAGFICTLASNANAGLITYSDANVGGFVPNSAFGTPSFLAAIGTPDEFLGFDGAGPVDGSTLSSNVVFSSSSSTTYGGTDSVNVNQSSSEMGPVGSWDGILNIDFLAVGNAASIVGFGPVEFGTIETINVYNQFSSLIGTFGGVSNNDFDFFGLQGTAGDLIGKITLEGDFFAIQDIQFDYSTVNAVPVPAALLMFAPALLGFLGLRRKAKA